MTALLTNSRLKDARACQRLHRYRYGLGYRPATDSEALKFGSLVHLLLEAWWLAYGLADQLEKCLAVIPADVDPFDRARVEALMTGYHVRWHGEPYRVISVEAQFEAPLINPGTSAPSRTWRLGGKLDALVEDLRDGLRRMVEHKTSSENITPGSEYWRRLRMDGQVSTYYAGADAMGQPVSGCVYDVIGKPSIRPLKATPLDARKYKKDGTLYAAQRDRDETAEEFKARLVEDIAANPAAYFQRGEVVRLEAEMTEAMHDIWQTGRQIREAELAGFYPRNPDACVRWGKTCPFFGVCTGEESLDDPSKFTRLESVHPELSPAESSKEESQQ